jgi:cell division protein FtsL
MNKFEKIVVALLGAIAIAGTVTAVEVVRMARNGFNVTIDIEEAEKIVEQANEAKAAALEDMAK